ncbi:putative reverse transcriptase domain-containing protein [Tanacetum coccineum]
MYPIHFRFHYMLSYTYTPQTFDLWYSAKGAVKLLVEVPYNNRISNAPILALPDRLEDFVVYFDVSGLGLGCVLMQRGKVTAYASRQLKIHEKNYTTHDLELGADKMYYNLRDRYWWPGMKKNIAMYMRIEMDFVTKLPRTSSGHDTIWVIVDRLTKSAHFLPTYEDYKMDRLARLYLNEIVARHGVPISIISDRDSRLTSRFWQSMQEALGTRLDMSEDYKMDRLSRFWQSMQEALGTWLDMSTTYHPQTDGQSERIIKTLEDMLRACVLDFGGSWDAKVGEGQLIGPELVQETTEKISQVKDTLKAARDRQKSYIDKRRKPLEFSVGNYVLLKVSSWKAVVGFRKKGKLALRFDGPFEIIKKVGLVAYRLDLLEELDGVHDTFHVSNLKKCLADPTLQVPLDEIRVDDRLNFMEEPVEITEREFKKLKRSRIAIVKVRWNSKRRPEFM